MGEQGGWGGSREGGWGGPRQGGHFCSSHPTSVPRLEGMGVEEFEQQS